MRYSSLSSGPNSVQSTLGALDRRCHCARSRVHYMGGRALSTYARVREGSGRSPLSANRSRCSSLLGLVGEPFNILLLAIVGVTTINGVRALIQRHSPRQHASIDAPHHWLGSDEQPLGQFRKLRRDTRSMETKICIDVDVGYANADASQSIGATDVATRRQPAYLCHR